MATTLTADHRPLPSSHIPAGIWTIAGLTLTEALRRRFWLGGLLVCGFFVLLALLPFHINAQRESMMGDQFSQFVGQVLGNLGSQMIEFFGFLFSVALGAGAISAELDRGTLAVILPKPLPRWAVYMGKWLGVNLFLLPMMVIMTGLLEWGIWVHVHFTEPSLWHALPVMYLYPLLFSTLTLCFSSFSASLLATIMPIIMACVAWSEGILKTFGYNFDIKSLQVASKCVIYVLPLNPMSRLHSQAENFSILQQFRPERFQAGPIDPPAGSIDVAWILGYVAAAWIIGLIIFQRRDL